MYPSYIKDKTMYQCKHTLKGNTECISKAGILTNVIHNIALYYSINAKMRETDDNKQLQIEKTKNEIRDLETKIENANKQFEAVKEIETKKLKKSLSMLSEVDFKPVLDKVLKIKKTEIDNQVAGYKVTINRLKPSLEMPSLTIIPNYIFNTLFKSKVSLDKIFDKFSDEVKYELCQTYIKEITISRIDTKTTNIKITLNNGFERTIIYNRQRKIKSEQLYYEDGRKWNSKV
jgi:hypothetical protein